MMGVTFPVYAFSAMLLSFLIGIAAGSAWRFASLQFLASLFSRLVLATR